MIFSGGGVDVELPPFCRMNMVQTGGFTPL